METSLIKTIREFRCSRTNCCLIFFFRCPLYNCQVNIKNVARNFLMSSSFIRQLRIMRKKLWLYYLCIKNFFQAHQKYNLVSVLCSQVLGKNSLLLQVLHLQYLKSIWRKLQSNIQDISLHVKYSMPGKRFAQRCLSFKGSRISVETKNSFLENYWTRDILCPF